MKHSHLWTRIAALAIAVCMLLMPAIGIAAVNSLPLTDVQESLSVWTYYGNQFFTDPNDLPAVNKIEEITNVHIDWVPIGIAEITEKFTALLLSDTIPDIIYPGGVVLPGGIEKAVEDGVFLDMTDLVNEYMPNYRAILSTNPEFMRDSLSDSGRHLFIANPVAGLNGIAAQEEFLGLSLRLDLLEKLGKDIPETMDDWYDLLTAAKEAGISKPLQVSATGFGLNGSFISAYGILQEFYLDAEDGLVKYGAAQPGYRDWIETMRKWYAEGLIDPDFVSTNHTYIPDVIGVATDTTLAFTALFTFTGKGLVAVGYTQNPDCTVQGVKNPVLTRGEIPKSNHIAPPAMANATYVSAKAKDPVLVAKWLDYQMSEEAMLLNYFGFEGETYILDENGDPQFTDVILQNPEGLTPANAVAQYVRGNGLGLYSYGAELLFNAGSDTLEAQHIWEDQIDLSLPQKMSMTEEEGRKYNAKYPDILTAVMEATVRYIMGLDDMDTYDTFVASLYDYGLEECLSYQQAAYERYINRGE